jgi:hypothetical protein
MPTEKADYPVVNIQVNHAVFQIGEVFRDHGPVHGGSNSFITPNPNDNPPMLSLAAPTVTGRVLNTPLNAGDSVVCTLIDSQGAKCTSAINTLNLTTGNWTCIFDFGGQPPAVTQYPNGEFALSLLTTYAGRNGGRLTPPVTMHVQVVA